MGRPKKKVHTKKNIVEDNEVEFVETKEAEHSDPIDETEIENPPEEETLNEEYNVDLNEEDTHSQEPAEVPQDPAAEESESELPPIEKETSTVQQQPRRQRGPTKMKHIAKDPNTREKVDFTNMGEPYGPGSVMLSSYVGPLVREHVPVTIEDWRKVGEDIRTVLWKSVQVTFS